MKNIFRERVFASIKPRVPPIKSGLNSGFTLIELLVVIAVVGVLAGAVIVMINPEAQFQRARDAKRKSDLKQIRNALERYQVVTGAYPLTVGYWAVSSNNNWIPGLTSSGELKSLPMDTTSNGCANGYPWQDGNICYWYAYSSQDGIKYDLAAHLENTQDSDRCQVKQWFLVWGGIPWCPTYSNQVYAPPYGQ